MRGKWGRSTLLASVVMIGLLLLCIRLGFWQLDRAEQKRTLLAAGNSSISFEAAIVAGEQGLWRQSSVRGRYAQEPPVLLDNQTHHGQPGYQVFSRFVTDGGAQLLVNRGWIAQGQRPHKPTAESVNIAGIIAPYRKAGFRLGPAVVSAPEVSPAVVNYPTQPEWEALLQAPLLPFTLWLAPAQPDGYVREWTLQSAAPEKHLGYAFQWFAMATAVAVIGLMLLFRILRAHD